MEVLPVGVTPVTAIPTRVRFGPTPRAAIEFADSKPAQVELSRLVGFSTEQQNPGNAKHVARIVVEVPTAWLRDGVTFVDTPGLGSLATSGAEETVAYLPRCDLGLVLVDAASTLTHEDLALVQALYQAGARAMLLVSKADLLQPSDRERTLAYAKQQLTRQLGVEPPVHLVSVLGTEATLCDQWFERELKPLLETHREQAAASLRRKSGGLRQAVVKALETRLQGTSPAVTAPDRQVMTKALTALRHTDHLLESAEKKAEELVEETPRLAGTNVEAAAEALAEGWRRRRLPPNEAADLCGDALRAVLSEHAAMLLNGLDALREQLENVLAQARKCVAGTEIEPLPKPSGLPLLDATNLIERAKFQPPTLGRLMGAPWLRRHVRTQLKAQLGFLLAEFLDSYRLRLRPWLRRALTELRAAFHARTGLLRIQLEASSATATTAETDVATMEADLRRLREWRGTRAVPAGRVAPAHAEDCAAADQDGFAD